MFIGVLLSSPAPEFCPCRLPDIHNSGGEEEPVDRETNGNGGGRQRGDGYAAENLRLVRQSHEIAAPGLFKDSYSNTFPSSLLPVEKKLDTNIHGEGRACISCSFCADACPVRIQPNLLHRYVLREIIEESLVQFGIFKCIECNLCTYVCPSKIPLAELMKKGKQMLQEEGLGNEEEIKAQFTLKGI